MVSVVFIKITCSRLGFIILYTYILNYRDIVIGLIVFRVSGQFMSKLALPF